MPTTTVIAPPSNRTRKRSSKQSKSTNSNDPIAHLKSLYPPAARAFLARNVILTQSLVDGAFNTLSVHPVSSLYPDPLALHRRKWDLLRITLEATFYSSPPTSPASSEHPSAAVDNLPPSLKELLQQPPSSLLNIMYFRSIRLFSPATPDGTIPTSSYLPPQILVALVYSALKLECPEVGRKFVEDWLAHRALSTLDPSQQSFSLANGSASVDPMDGYERVIDAYCSQVLPRLGEWEYAFDFLKCEQELTQDKKKHIYTSLKTLHAHAMNPPPPPARRLIPTSRTNGSASTSLHSASPERSSDRAITPLSSSSPAPDHIAVPPSRLGANGSSLSFTSSTPLARSTSALSSSSISSSASQATITPNAIARRAVGNGESHLSHSNGHANTKSGSKLASPHRAREDGHVPQDVSISTSNSGSSSSSVTAFPRPPLAPPFNPSSTSPSPSSSSALSKHDPSDTSPSFADSPSLFEMFKMYISSRRRGRGNLTIPIVLAVLSILVPLLGYLMRVNVRRRAVQRGSIVGGRIQGSQVGVLRWFVGAVKDTVIMAGKGLI